MQCLKEVSLGSAVTLQLVTNRWSDENNKEFARVHRFGAYPNYGIDVRFVSLGFFHVKGNVAVLALGIPGWLINPCEKSRVSTTNRWGRKRLWWKRRFGSGTALRLVLVGPTSVRQFDKQQSLMVPHFETLFGSASHPLFQVLSIYRASPWLHPYQLEIKARSLLIFNIPIQRLGGSGWELVGIHIPNKDWGAKELRLGFPNHAI